MSTSCLLPILFCSLFQFPTQSSWLGGDVAASIPISNDKSIWLFGDSFVDSETELNRRKAAFINNSVGVMTFTNQPDSPFQITYHHKVDKAGQAASFFRLPMHNERHFFWPKSGFLYKNKLYVALLEVQIEKLSALEFVIQSVHLAQVSNPESPPDIWKIRYLRLKDSHRRFHPGTSFVVAGNLIYAFATSTDHHGKKSIVLQKWSGIQLDSTRFTDKNEAPATAEFSVDSQYQKTLFDDAADEMSITKISDDPKNPISLRNKWVATYSTALKQTASYRTAMQLSGPWSAPLPLVTYPVNSDPQLKNQLFYYAAKLHNTPMGPMVTFVNNTVDGEFTLRDNKIYVPYYTFLVETK